MVASYFNGNVIKTNRNGFIGSLKKPTLCMKYIENGVMVRGRVEEGLMSHKIVRIYKIKN